MEPGPPYDWDFLHGHIGPRVVLRLFGAALCSVGTATVLALPGVLLAHSGVVTREVSRGLSQISMQITIPCLLFSTVAQGADKAMILSSWPLLVLPFVYVALGSALGGLVVLACGAGRRSPPQASKHHHHAHHATPGITIAACAFGNSTGMPIVLLHAVHTELRGPEDVRPLLFLSVYLVFYPMLQWTIASWLLGVNEKMPQWADAHPPPIGDAGARAEADRPMQRRATGGGLAVGFTERSGRELDAHLCVLGAERAPPLGAVRSEGELGLGGGGRMCDWWSDLEAGRPPAWQAPSLAESLSACSAPATLARPAARAPHRAAEERAPLRSRPSALGHIRASASLAAIPTQPPGLAMHDECAVARSVSLSYALRPATPPLPLRQASGDSSSASSPALSDQMPSLFGIADGERFMLVRPSASDSSGSDEPVEEHAAAAPRRASALLGASARTLSSDKGEWQGEWQGDWLGAARQPRLEPQPPSARSVACGASQAGVDLELAAAPAHAAGGGLIRMVTPRPARARSSGRLARALRWARKADYYARQFFKPAVVATILGVAVGLTPRLKALLVPAPTAPLYWLLEGVSTVGDAAVPLNLMLLGASLSKGPSWAQISLRANVGIVLAKMVLMPLLAAGLVVLFARRAEIDAHARDTLWLVALVVTATPTANNLLVMCDATGQGKNAMATAIFTQYLVAPIVLPCTITLFVIVVSSALEAHDSR